MRPGKIRFSPIIKALKKQLHNYSKRSFYPLFPFPSPFSQGGMDGFRAGFIEECRQGILLRGRREFDGTSYKGVWGGKAKTAMLPVSSSYTPISITLVMDD